MRARERKRTSPRCVLQKGHVHRACGQVDVSHYRAADEDILDGALVPQPVSGVAIYVVVMKRDLFDGRDRPGSSVEGG